MKLIKSIELKNKKLSLLQDLVNNIFIIEYITSSGIEVLQSVSLKKSLDIFDACMLLLK